MKYGKVTLGQVEAVLNKLGGANGMHRFLSGELKVISADSSSKQVVRTRRPKLLIKDGYYVAVTLIERHNPGLFYRDRAGLYVYPNFLGKIVSTAVPTEAGKKFKKVSRFRLAADATGKQLRSGHPNMVWNATDFCAWLAPKLTNQSNGEEGELLNNDCSNLFLVEGVSGEVVLVGVRWFSIYREWYVDAWRLAYVWSAGDQFASCN